MNLRKELPVFFALLGFIMVLSSLYLHSQPYRYYESTSTLLQSLHLDEANSVTTTDDMKKWFFGLREAVAPISSHSIDINCADINNNNDNTSNHCRYHDLIQQEFSSKPVTLGNGYHEIIQFSLFVRRGGYPTFPDDMFEDPKQSLSKTSTNTNSEAVALDPMVIAVMRVDDGNNIYTCVLEDGFRGELGSTLQWIGVQIEGVYAFAPESVIHVHTPHVWKPYRPCFSYINNTSTDAGDSYELVFGHGHPGYGTDASVLMYDFENATVSFEGMFISSAHFVRRKCLEYNTPQLSPHQNFMTTISQEYEFTNGTFPFNTFVDILDYWYGCSALTAENVTFDYLDSRYLHDPSVTRIEMDGAYGNFFDTNSEYLWQLEAAITLFQLEMLGVFDSVRESLKLYVTVRNVQEDRLFYSMISADFIFSTSGKVSLDVEIAFVPIVQYYYGTEDYPLVFVSWFVADVLIACVWFYVLARIIYKSCYSTRKVISKVKEKSNNNNATLFNYSQDLSHPDMTDLDLDLYLSSCENSENGSVLGTGMGTNDQEKKDDGDDDDHGDTSSWNSLTAGVFHVEMVLDISLLVFLSAYISSRSVWYLTYKDLHAHIVSLPEGRDLEYYRSSEYISTLVSKTDNIHTREVNARYLGFVLVMTAMIVFFVELSKSRKFNVVTRSIHRSMLKIWPTLLVLMVILMAYAMLGCVLYGSTIPGWSSVYGAFTTLFIMLLGEFGVYDEIKKMYPILTAIYFWTFLVIVYFVIFNVALAIILDAYAEVNAESRAYRLLKQEKKINKDK